MSTHQYVPDLGIAGRTERDSQSRSGLVEDTPAAVGGAAAGEGASLVAAS